MKNVMKRVVLGLAMSFTIAGIASAQAPPVVNIGNPAPGAQPADLIRVSTTWTSNNVYNLQVRRRTAIATPRPTAQFFPRCHAMQPDIAFYRVTVSALDAHRTETNSPQLASSADGIGGRFVDSAAPHFVDSDQSKYLSFPSDALSL